MHPQRPPSSPITDLPLRKHSAVMRDHLELAGAQVLDVGCGDGSLVRFMIREGAAAIGLETSEVQLARARAAGQGEPYFIGRGEALPFAAGSLDLVVLFNSLHHIPVESQAEALREAARVLRPGGQILIQEPVAEGAYFEMMRPLEDETFVRAEAYAAIKALLLDPRIVEDAEVAYRAPFKHASFEAFVKGFVAVDPRREAAVTAHKTSLRETFETVAEQRAGAFWFENPCRMNLLRRV